MATVADTAFSIAVIRADEASLPERERLFEDPYAHIFAKHGEHAAEATARYLALPMFREGIRLRTRFIDDAVRDGIGVGLRQLVLFGAGFDARGLRLPEVKATGTRVYEVDFPSQIARKLEWISAEHIELDHINFVGFDFGRPDFEDALIVALEAAGFERGAGAIFVWEGVIGYIDDAMIERSLRAMVRAGGARSRLIFTAHDGAFDPESAEARMRRHGFSSCTEIGMDVAWRKWLPSEPHEHARIMRLGIAII